MPSIFKHQAAQVFVLLHYTCTTTLLPKTCKNNALSLCYLNFTLLWRHRLIPKYTYHNTCSVFHTIYIDISFIPKECTRNLTLIFTQIIVYISVYKCWPLDDIKETIIGKGKQINYRLKFNDNIDIRKVQPNTFPNAPLPRILVRVSWSLMKVGNVCTNRLNTASRKVWVTS